MRKNFIAFMVIFGLMFCSSLAFGGEIFEVGKFDLPGNTIYIWYGGTERLGFLLSEDSKDWKEFFLDSDEGVDYGGSETFFIKITTGNQAKSYRLPPADRYQIFWNNKVKAWDVAYLKPR